MEYGEVCLLPRHYRPRAGAGQTRSTLARLEGHIAAPLMQVGREVGLHIFVFCINTRQPSLLPFPKPSLKLHVKALSGGGILEEGKGAKSTWVSAGLGCLRMSLPE